MRAVLFCLGDPQKKQKNGDTAQARRIFQINAVQTLALARCIGERHSSPPLLVLDSGGYLEQAARENGLPYFSAGPLLGFRLWRWQAREPRLVIQTVGVRSAGSGYRLFRMRKKNSATLAHAFFAEWPDRDIMQGKAFKRARYVLCGDSLIAAHVRALCPGGVRLLPDAPGIELEQWAPAQCWQPGERHFVFGMGQSLEAASGALLVIRAMSALWQRPDLPQWEVRMFGSGPRFQEILDEAEKLGVAARLCLLSDQPLCREAAKCHAWLLPGENPGELPEVSWAGIAAGAPVICVQNTLHEERLAARSNEPSPVLRVRPHDPQGIARAMIGVMKNERLRKRLARGGAAIRPQIAVEAMAARTIGFYEKWWEELQEPSGMLKN